MLKIILLCLVVLSSCYPNRVDKQHRRQGRWKLWYDDEKTKPMWTGRYKDHELTGTWNYYSPSGYRYLRERYLKNNAVKTTYYYSNGKKQLQGYAVYYETEDTAYYRWEGDWCKYDSTTGKLMQVSYYKFGKFAWYKPLNSKINR